MTTRFGRNLAGLRRLTGAALVLALCGHAAYTAGARNRDEPGAAPILRTCAAMPQG